MLILLDRMKYEDILKIIVDRYKEILKENLANIYVHGPITPNCFDFDKDNIDFIVVIKEQISINQKKELIELLLDLNQFAPKKGFEMNVVLLENTQNFKNSTHFELHFSNDDIINYRKNPTKYLEVMYGKGENLSLSFGLNYNSYIKIF